MSAPISQAISQLINGVSQQSPEMRLATQAELQVNAYSSPVDGLKKRPGTTHVARLMDAPVEDPYVHTINRDTSEQYQAVLTNGDLKVFDLKTGVEQTVNFPLGKDYLKAVNPRHTMRALTVEDYTFILNKKVRPRIAPVPYFETDQLSAAVSFGSGVLINEGIRAEPPRMQWRAWYRHPSYVNSLNPFGWERIPSGVAIPNGALDTLGELVSSMNETLGGYYQVPLITLDDIKVVQAVATPAAIPGGNSTAELPHPVTPSNIRLGLKTGAVTLHYENMDGEPLTFISPLVIEYNRTDSNNLYVSGQDLWQDVGWPDTSYSAPGQTRYVYEKFPGTGDIELTVNHYTFTKAIDNTWSTPQYAQWFADQVRAVFPDYEVTVDNYVLSIKAPQGQPLWVSCSSVPVDLVKTVYQDLPTQEAVFVVIKQGVANQTYSVSINGTQVEYSTGNTDQPETYRAETIATNLANALNNANAGFQAATYGGFIRVIRPDKATMTFAFKDTWGNQAMYAMKNRVNAFEDLPPNFIPGYPIEVAGVGSSGYYVHWVQKNRQATASYGLGNQMARELGLNLVSTAGNVWTANEGEDTGIWDECAKPGSLSALNPATMPHALIREADGTFTFKPLTWGIRECGDNASVPVPSFVDKRIVDLFFHRNRLGFLAESSVLFSRSGEFFNLWPLTAKDVLDGDPIDTLVNHTRVSTLRHTAVFNNQLLLFSDNTQFVVSAQNLLTPKTVTIQPSTEFDCSPEVKPVNSGNNVFFLANRGDYSQLREYFVLTNAVANTSTDVTAHVPRYVPQGVFKLSLSNAEDMLMVLNEGQRNKVHVYKFLWNGEKKLQESWSEFDYGREVVNVDFIGDRGYLLFRDEGGLHLEVSDFGSNFQDGPLGALHLDRKVTLSGVVNSSRETLISLPFAVTSNLVAVDMGTGAALDYTQVDDHTVKFRGQRSGVLFGLSYEMRYRFSPLYFRNQGNAVTGSQLMVKTFEVVFTQAVSFDLKVKLPGRTERSNVFVSRQTGQLGSLLGSVQVTGGRHRVSVMAEGRDTGVELVSHNHYPLTVLSAAYEGQFNMRTRRV